jgi:hypothetical protein
MKFRLLALPLFVAGVLSAQGPGPRGSSLTPPTASEVLQRQVDFLTKFYSLTTTQAATVTTIVSTEQSCLPTSAKMTAARQALVTGVKTGGSALTAGVSGVNDLQATQEGCRATAASAIWALLDPTTQQIKGIGPLLGGPGGRGGGPGFHHGPPPKQ